jgi:hypothetical protein
MNPFAERSSMHGTWPVIMTIYNLPSWLCQKRKYLLLTILISGPTQPGVDMDVFLEPLMQEMQILWEVGVKMIDVFLKETFTLRAIIIVTINDYPALFSLSGQFKGKVGCVECIDGTWHVSLPPSNKIVYMRHRRWLPAGHKYCLQKMTKYFDNMDESKSTAPSGYSKGHRVYKIVENVKFVFGKKTKDGKPRKVVKANKGDTFKKKSIFFKYLSYWKWTVDDYVNVPSNYVPGRPMLQWTVLEKGPWMIKRFHDWYMRAVNAGLHAVSVDIPAGVFATGKDKSGAFVTFEDMHLLLNYRKLDVQLITIWCL